MQVKPDSIRYALGLLAREWGSYGYAIEKLDGDWHVAVITVAHGDGSRFVIAANDYTGQWGYADGEDTAAVIAACERMDSAVYIDGRWTQPPAEPTACQHERTRQISEHDVECLDCGLVSA